MGEWGYTPGEQSGLKEGKRPGPCGGDLTKVVRLLSPKAKQAMFSAATHGLIKRGTWNHCAFNAASIEVGGNVNSVSTAAQMFDVPQSAVSAFISCWDALQGPDEEATQKLRDAIEQVGLFTEPSDFTKSGKRKPRTVVKMTVYKSEETRMREQFDQLMADNDVELTTEAAELLNSVFA